MVVGLRDAKHRRVFNIESEMRNPCDLDSRCGLVSDASARDARLLAVWVERREQLILRTRRPGKKWVSGLRPEIRKK